MEKIRLGRTKPGLRPQHLTGLKLVERICRSKSKGAVKGSEFREMNNSTYLAESVDKEGEFCPLGLTGGAVGSTQIDFRPRGPCACGSYEADTQTAGSCTLMVQVALPCLLFARTTSR